VSDEPNEILAAAKAAKDRSDAVKDADGKERSWPVAAFGVGVGVGIGSAAIAGALLFANRSRSKK
jgi:hypothetical protein